MQDAVFIVFAVTLVAFVALSINFALAARRRERKTFIQTAMRSGPSTINPFAPNGGAVIDVEFEPVDTPRRRPAAPSSRDQARNTHNRARSKQCHRTIIAHKAWAKSLNVLRDAG
ncbi:MAG: hypothetical protein AAFX54_17670 [Pseudomonadota bacterium]